MFLSFKKNKETKCISVKISNKLKRTAVSLPKMCRSKMFVARQNFLKTLEIHYKIFDNSYLKIGKREKAKILKKHVWRPAYRKPNFYANWICYWQIKLCSYNAFHLTKCLNQYCKNFTGPPFRGGWTTKLQTFSRHFFWEWPSKYCIVEFTAIFVCLLFRWSIRYLMNWSINLDGYTSIFQIW